MDELTLIVAPDRSGFRRVLRRLSGRSFTWAYLGQDVARFHLVRQSFEGQGTQLDTSHSFHQAAEALREPYLKYLYDMGRGLNSLRWWITSLSYRSSYVSKTFQQSCYLKVALALVETWEGPGPLVVVVADNPVRVALERNLPDYTGVRGRRTNPFQWARDTASMMVHRAFFLAREGSRLIQSRWMIRRPDLPTDPATLLISSVHSGNVNQGGDFHKSSFGDLATRLGELGYSVAMAPMILRDVSYAESLRRLQNLPAPLLVPHRYLRLRDLLWAVISTWRRIPLREPLEPLTGMDISALVKEDLRLHWISNRAADALLMAALMRRWANLGVPIARIIYKYENQPWERALCWGAKRYLPEAKLVGYQHARAPLLYLNYYLAPGEEAEAPLPDRVVTIGKHTARLLSSDGYGPGRIRVGGALHIPGIDVQPPPAVEPLGPVSDAPVLVACSYGLEEASELADLAARLFDEDEGVSVVIKCHPAMPFRNFQQLMRGPLPKHVRVSEEPIIDLIPKSSIMVYTGSMVCVQALATGLPVIHLRPQFDLDIDPLGAVPDVRPEATGLEELRREVRWLLNHREEYIAQQQDRWASLVHDIYGPVTEEAIRAFVD